MTLSDPRGLSPAPDYHFRRPLSLRDQLPAVAVAVGAAAVAFYVTRILIQRTPLRPAHDFPTLGAKGAITRRPARRVDGE